MPQRSARKKSGTTARKSAPAKRSKRTKASAHDAASKAHVGIPDQTTGTASTVAAVRFVLPGGETLRWDGPADEQLRTVTEFQRVAVQWTYRVSNRRRWAEREASVNQQAERARELLQRLGMSESGREQLASAGHVEVVIPWTHEETGWELRIFPWEYLLSAGTRDLRGGQSLSVVRRLELAGVTRPLPAAPRALYVQSVAAPLRDVYDFAAENRMVRAAMTPEGFRECINPTPAELERAIVEHNPHIVHLAGFDSHQGLTLLNDASAGSVLDGYLLRSETGSALPVPGSELARILSRGSLPPSLVTLNLHNSAGRVAPMLIAAGIGAALAFQDTFDDALAELFFNSFYHGLSLADGDLVIAFDLAWNEMREQPQSVKGSGLVLWSSTPLLAPAVTSPPTVRSEIGRTLAQERAVVINPDEVADLSEIMQVTVEPLKEANYSLLHNNRGLFREFSIRKLKPGRVEQLEVNVELHVGADTYPYRRSFTMTEQFEDLNRLVRVPLTSLISRSRHEAMHTSLFVELLWGPPGRTRELFRDTLRVTLLPSDQWRDDDTDRIWLPSFVLPRDPAVSRIIEKAQRYLMALRDEPSAGFDGYQSIDPREEEPYECVDLQVQAIWSAILYDHGLAYVNPPPSYSIASQRVRTPTEIVSGGRGTCLDLTLLLAACLEFVEIYPVVFLLHGHAFPGYWRSAEAHEAFAEVASADPDSVETTDARGAMRTAPQREAWHLPAAMWPEVMQRVRAGDLVPIESVWLTTHSGFNDAVDAGYENLKPRQEFDSLLDVILARGRSVTPLPIQESSE